MLDLAVNGRVALDLGQQHAHVRRRERVNVHAVDARLAHDVVDDLLRDGRVLLALRPQQPLVKVVRALVRVLGGLEHRRPVKQLRLVVLCVVVHARVAARGAAHGRQLGVHDQVPAPAARGAPVAERSGVGRGLLVQDGPRLGAAGVHGAPAGDEPREPVLARGGHEGHGDEGRDGRGGPPQVRAQAAAEGRVGDEPRGRDVHKLGVFHRTLFVWAREKDGSPLESSVLERRGRVS